MEELKNNSSCSLCGEGELQLFLTGGVSDSTAKKDYASRGVASNMFNKYYRCSYCDGILSDHKDIKSYQQGVVQGDFSSSRESFEAAKTNYKLVKEYLTEGSRVLEIGCSDAAFLRLLSNQKRYAVEPCHKSSCIAKKFIKNLFQGYWQDYKENDFDQIFCFQTIEHFLHINKDVQKVYDSLKPGGDFFLTAHNYSSLINKVLGKKSPIFDYQHFQVFNLKSISIFLQNIGFEVLECRQFCNTYNLSYAFRLLGIDLKLALDPRIPFPVGNIFVRARRPIFQ